jgi:hypothetical protein
MVEILKLVYENPLETVVFLTVIGMSVEFAIRAWRGKNNEN